MYLFQGAGLDLSVAIMHNFQSLDFYSHLVGSIGLDRCMVCTYHIYHLII